MRNAPAISLIASLSKDTLVNESGQVLAKVKGGPGKFIGAALQKEDLKYAAYYGKPVGVEILLAGESEFGRIPALPPSQVIGESMLAPWTIVSSICGEWQFATDPIPNGMNVCVDLQGFVRDGADFGKKKIWEGVAALAPDIFCIKGTREEVGYLPADVCEDQKQRLLVVTDGSAGVALFYQGKRNKIACEKVAGIKDTIGAGDTFFGYFVAAL